MERPCLLRNVEGKSPFVRYWLPVILWMGIIFVGSTSLLSSHQTARFLGPFLRWLAPDISEEAIARVQFGVRKSGHLIEYAVLGALLWRAIRQPQSNERGAWKWRPVAWAFAGSVLYAMSDEYHQSLVSTRFATGWDVMIDALGAALGLVSVWYKRMRRGGS